LSRQASKLAAFVDHVDLVFDPPVADDALGDGQDLAVFVIRADRAGSLCQGVTRDL